MRLAPIAVCGAVATLLSSAAVAQAATTTLSFDGLADGTVVSTLSGATFAGGPTVFTPQHTTTQSPPRALHTPTACAGPAPGQACSRQTVTFASPASSVSLRVGLDDDRAPDEFPVSAQLKAYDASGTKVADTGDVTVGSGGYKPITKLLSAQSARTDITRVELLVGDTDLYDYPAERVDLDDLTFTDDVPPAVAPPQVSLLDPRDGDTFVRISDVHLIGRAVAPAGIVRFCATTDATIPATCADTGALGADGSFQGLAPRGLRPGTNHITVWLEDRQARVASTSVDVVVSSVDLRPANMEVTQAVQTALPAVTPPSFSGEHSAVYNGVPLAAGKATYVRVWAGARFVAGPPTLNGVRMLLSGTRGGQSLGAPLLPLNGGRAITAADPTDPAITDAVRSSPSSAYVFQLPPAWTQGDVSLTATMNPPQAGAITECDDCAANDVLRLDGVGFTPLRTETVTPMEEVVRTAGGGLARPPSAAAAFAATAAVSPFPMLVRPYQAQADITALFGSGPCDLGCQDAINSAAVGPVVDFDQATAASNRQGHIVGVSQGSDPRGLTVPVVFCCLPPRIDTLAITTASRPLTSVAHEYYHQLGFAHAGYSCPQAPGGFLGLFAEHWDPDDQGRLQSFGIDPRAGSGGAAGPLAVEGTQDAAGAPTPFFDLMSYCAGGESGAWISARNWTRALTAHMATGRAARAGASPAVASPAAASKTLLVSAIQVAGQPAAVSVQHETRGTAPVPAGARDATVQLLDAAGRVVARAATVALRGHVDQGPGVVSIGATLPDRPGAVRADVRLAGKMVARLKRPAVRPVVRISAPRKGARVGATGTVGLRWSVRRGRARKTTIDFAADGRHFRPVVLGVTGRSYRVPVSLLGKGAKARLRVRVSDGWDEGVAVSAPLRVAGPPPVTALTDTAGVPRVAASGALQLHAVGFGDHGRRLPAQRLSWWAGRRLLARGETVRLAGLRPGRRHVRLVATTPDGRRSSRRVPIDVTGPDGS